MKLNLISTSIIERYDITLKISLVDISISDFLDVCNMDFNIWNDALTH